MGLKGHHVEISFQPNVTIVENNIHRMWSMMNIQNKPMMKTMMMDTVYYELYYNADAMPDDQSRKLPKEE